MNRQFSVQSKPIRLPRDFESIAEAFDTELAGVELEGEVSGYSAERIQWVQKSLNKILGLRLAVDGVMGPRTRSGIRIFQKQRGLAADGIVGPKTEAALLAALKNASVAAARSSYTPSVSSAPPGYIPSPTRQRFEEAVGRNDWRQAFLNLNGLNMYEMLRALDSLSPERRNGLVAQRPTYRGLVNMPRIEYAMTVVQTRQLPPVAPGDLAATGQVQTAIEFLQAPAMDWTQVSPNDRMAYAMRRLIQNYGFPENGAAGLVGNLWAESGLLPNRVEGSSMNTPMRAPDFNGQQANFTAEQIMNRNSQRRQGPRLPGIGLAQWTAPSRRLGLFQYSYGGRQLGAAILFHMDAQFDYLVNELSDKYRQVYNLLMGPTVTLESASDEILYNFEIPGAILGPQDPISGRRKRLPRNDQRVQEVFTRRRAHARQALNLYRQVPQEA